MLDRAAVLDVGRQTYLSAHSTTGRASAPACLRAYVSSFVDLQQSELQLALKCSLSAGFIRAVLERSNRIEAFIKLSLMKEVPSVTEIHRTDTMNLINHHYAADLRRNTRLVIVRVSTSSGSIPNPKRLVRVNALQRFVFVP